MVNLRQANTLNFAPKCKSEAQRVEFFKKFSTQAYKLGGNRAKDLKAPKTACQARFGHFCESNVNGYSQKTSNGVENSATDVEKCGAMRNAEWSVRTDSRARGYANAE